MTHSSGIPFLSTMRRSLILVLLYPWMIGCSTQHLLRTSNESSIELMGGRGVSTQTIYEIQTVPTCDGGSQQQKTAIGKYDAGFVDIGVRFAEIYAENGFIFDLGAGTVTTTNRSDRREYHPAAYGASPISDATQTPYGFMSFGREYDYFGWSLGIFFNDRLHYDDARILPTFRQRLGRLDGFHVEFGMMRNPIDLTSGRIADAGFGFRADYIKTDLYLAMGMTNKFENGQFLLATETHTSEKFSIKSDMHFGVLNRTSDPSDPLEFGISVGFKYRW